MQLGIVFDIDELGGGLYGYAAYKIFFDAVDTRQIPGCSLNDGDTSATLARRANQYCIAVESLDASKIATVKSTIGKLNAKGLLPPSSRFLDDTHVCREPLVLAAHIDLLGQIVGDKTGWLMRAWKESQEKHQGPSSTGIPSPSISAAGPIEEPKTPAAGITHKPEKKWWEFWK